MGSGWDAEQAAALLKEQGLHQVKRLEDRETREGRIFLRGIRESLVLRTLKTLAAGPGERLTGYVHGEGRIGAVIALQAPEAAWDHVRGLGQELALHIAACAPRFLSRAVVDPGYLSAIQEEYRADARALGKAERLLEAIVKGKLKKHLARVCLLEQPYFKDESSTMEDVVAAARAASGFDVRVSGFLYDRVGD